MVSSWDELEYKNDIITMSQILAYDQVRAHEEWELKKMEIESMIGSKIK